MPTLKDTPTHQGTKARREGATTIVEQRSATATSLTEIKDTPTINNTYPTDGKGNGTQARSTWEISGTV